MNYGLMSALPRPADSSQLLHGDGCLVIVATYNEIENLPKLVAGIRENLPAAHVLVIDDGSPDGTGKWCDQFSQEQAAVSQSESDSRWFHVIHRSGKLGLGSATITGFEWALKHDYRRVLTMDADFSHSPDQMSRLLQRKLEMSKQETTAGIVIGSRYVPGGEIEGWPWTRRFASRWINRFARFWLRLKSKDNSGAFRCYDAAALRRIPLQQITNQGYGYLEEILFLARRSGVVVSEVPITFRDRIEGHSKISLGEAVGALMTLIRLGIRLRWSRKLEQSET